METTKQSPIGNSREVLMKEVLLACGILSSVLYVLMNIFIPMKFEGYSCTSQTVSELSAIGAPTRPLWVILAVVYELLVASFGIGVWQSSKDNRRLRVLGGLILIYSLINIYWPPMHLRGIEPTLTDTLHIVWSAVTVLLMMVMMGFGAVAFGKKFKVYTIVSMVLLVGFGILTGLDAPNIPKDLPTPLLGVWERIMIGIFMLWISVLAIAIVRLINRSKGKSIEGNT